MNTVRWRFSNDGDIFLATVVRRSGNWYYWVADDGFEFKTNGIRGSRTPEDALRGLCWSLCCLYFDPRKESARRPDTFRDQLVLAMKAYDRAKAIVVTESAKNKQCCDGDGI